MLQGVQVPQAIRDEAVRDLAGRGTPRHFPTGQTIFAEGDPGHDLIVLKTGQVEISKITHAGRKLVLTHLGGGDLLGELALLDQGPRSATATALSDVTGSSVGFNDFRAFLMDFPDVHFALTVELCAKLRSANAMLEDQTEKSGDARMARAVMRLAEKFGKPGEDGIDIPIPLSQSDIGDLAGLARPNVNRYLRAWSDQGFVRFEKQHLTVLDPDGLGALADS